MGQAKRLLQEKLEYFLKEQAKNADPERGFQLEKAIEKVRRELEEIEAKTALSLPSDIDLPQPPIHRNTLRFVPHRIGGLAILAVSALIVWWIYFRPQQQALHSVLELARHSMASGRYPEAMLHFQEAIVLDSRNQEAILGVQKAELAQEMTQGDHDDPVRSFTILQVLQIDNPLDADLLMLEGDLLARDPLPEKQALARPKYEEALRENPKLAEAHFRLGVLSAREGDADAALRHYQEAARLEPAEKYQGNLAEQYLQRGDYGQAVRIYEGLDEYPLARLEAAKAYWARGELKQALDGQTLALRWLADPQVAALPKNHVRWRLDTAPDGAAISVATAGCKHYYAALALAASRFLLDGKETMPTADCESGDKIKQAVAEDLRRYALTQPRQAQAVQAFRMRLSEQ